MLAFKKGGFFTQMYIENVPFICHTSITKKEESQMDVIELLLFLRDNPLPQDKEKRIQLLTTLSQTDMFIIYEDVIRYSDTFAMQYHTDYIKSLLREYNIRGLNIYKEIQKSDMDEENKQLLYFFFKGKVDFT